MGDESLRMLELSLEGFNCSQILLQLALEAQGKTNPDLVRAMSGLVAGLGCGKICGAASGGCCFLGLFAGRAIADELEDSRLPGMLREFMEWFEQEYTSRFGGINCGDIVLDDARLRLSRCPSIISETYDKLQEILAANNFVPGGQAEVGFPR